MSRHAPIRTLLLVAATAAAIGCSKSDSPTSPTPPTSGPASGGSGSTRIVATGADLAFCVTETNRYRATLGLGALAQHGPSEEFAAAAASSDHQSGIPHAYFRANASGNTAENQANRWPNAQAGGSAHEFISRALAMMWAEGPGGGHYENMRGRWGFLGCGIASDSSSATFVQEFR